MTQATAEMTEPDAPTRELGRLQGFLVAVACGALAANLYYAQPLVDLIGRSLSLGEGVEGLIVTASQIGYAIGLIFLVPLGDLVESRRLIVATMLANVVALVGMVLTGSTATFFVAMFAVGITSTAAQILIPLAAGLTREERRGAVVGRVMSGLLTGILVARPVSSFLADFIGWRGVFVLSAVLVAALSMILARLLPEHRSQTRASYLSLIRSLGHLVATEPVLRRRAFYHSMLFAAFTLFWTGAPLLLLSPAYGFSPAQVALFALAGVLGVFAAPVSGALADRGHSRITTIAALATVMIAFIAAFFGEGSLAALVVAAILVDLGVQANMVVSQRAIFSLDPAIRNRLNAVYMATFFLGGALGSALTSPVLHYLGWHAFAALGIAFPAAALVAFLIVDPKHESG